MSNQDLPGWAMCCGTVFDLSDPDSAAEFHSEHNHDKEVTA